MASLSLNNAAIEVKMLTRSHDWAQVYVDTVGDPDKYRIKLSESFPFVKFVVAKKAGSLYPVVSGASIVAKVVISHPFDSLNLFMPICLSFVQPRRLQEIGPCEDGYLMKQRKTRLGVLDLDTLEVSIAYSSL